jgi:hypothetical protein
VAGFHYAILSGKHELLQHFISMWAGLGIANVGYWELLVGRLGLKMRGSNA